MDETGEGRWPERVTPSQKTLILPTAREGMIRAESNRICHKKEVMTSAFRSHDPPEGSVTDENGKHTDEKKGRRGIRIPRRLFPQIPGAPYLIQSSFPDCLV